MYNRIENLCKDNNTNITEMCKQAGVSRAALTDLKKGRSSSLSAKTIQKIAKYFNVSTDYLMNGMEEAEMYAEAEPIADAVNKMMADPRLKDVVLGIAGSIENIFPIQKKKIPLLGEIACGEPIYADEDRESYVICGTDIKADFCLRAKGDSMTGARIMDGDIVFIRAQSMVDNGEIAAVIIDDDATLKRVYYYPESQKLILQSENPKYEPFVYIGEGLEQIRILGKAIAFQSDVR